MSITRRQFLGYTAGVVTAGLRGLPLDPTSRRYVLLDWNERGCFRESVSGYESALTSAQAQWMRLGPVPPEVAGPLNERFQRALRRFYDQRRRAS